MLLHANKDDFKLRALYDTERNPAFVALYPFYLVDELGNRLTDESGNYLIGLEESTIAPQILNALPDDFKLNAE